MVGFVYDIIDILSLFTSRIILLLPVFYLAFVSGYVLRRFPISRMWLGAKVK